MGRPVAKPVATSQTQPAPMAQEAPAQAAASATAPVYHDEAAREIIGKIRTGPATIIPNAQASYAQYCETVGQLGSEPMNFDQWTWAEVSSKLAEVVLPARRGDSGESAPKKPKVSVAAPATLQ